MSFAKKYQLAIAAAGLLCTAVSAVAGTNPISVSLTPSTGIPATTTTGNSYAVHYTLTNNLPFAQPLGTIDRTINGTGFTVTDNCSGKTLAASGGTCEVDVRFQPSESGAHSIKLTLNYDKNKVPLPTQSTTTQGASTGDVTGAVTQELPASTTVNIGYNVAFTFTNQNSSSSVTASSITYTGDTAGLTNKVNGCSGAIAPGNSCTVSATYTPGTTGAKNVGVTYNYDSGSKSVPLETHTVATSSTGGCASVTGSTSLAMPTETYIYGDNVVKFKYTNNCSAASATLGTVNLNATLGSTSLIRGTQQGPLNQDVSSWITKGDDTCSGQTLGPNQSCTIDASINPQATGSNLNISGDVSYTESSQSKTAEAATSSNTVNPNSTSSRTVTVINQCSFPVWASTVAAAAPGTPAPRCNASKGGCPTGTQCLTAGGICYFTNPSVPNNGKLDGAQANQAPSTFNITIPEDNAGSSPLSNVVYNAGIVARRGCSGTGSSLSCTENNCGGTVAPTAGGTDSQGLCTPGVGVSTSPGMSYNAVEFTFLKTGNSDGVYDEQTINGVNVPMEMKGRGPATSGTAPYNNCAGTGAVIQKTTGATNTQLGACNYNYTPPSNLPAPNSGTAAPASNYRFVTPVGNVDCESSDSDCNGTGHVCGLAYVNFGGSTGFKLTKRCGIVQGHVSVNTAICSQASTIFHNTPAMTQLQTEYNCSRNYPVTGTSDTVSGSQLYACSGTYAGQSCYNPAPGNPATSCCGCVDWWDNGITVPHGTGTPTKLCGIYKNPHWIDPAGTVQSQVQWMKQACPTAYSYQFDDPSSSFQCTVKNNNNITTNYQVTFCPGGKSLSN